MSASEYITARLVRDVLQRHIGSENGVSAGNLVYEITGEAPTPHTERRLREVITELRLEGYPVCAHPATGYYYAAEADELNATCLFLYERAMASLKQIAAMKRVALPDLRGQLKLPIVN